MDKLVAELKTECHELYDFVASLSEDDWKKPTAFFHWTTLDEIIHIYFVDLLGLLSLRDTPKFDALAAEMKAAGDKGIELSEFTRRFVGPITREGALKLWRDNFVDMYTYFGSLDPKTRMKWFGPDMSVASFASARQMEAWAHGQDIYDLFRIRRKNTDRLKNIAVLGVRTFGWSFANRDLPVPSAVPYVELTSPSGATWRWNEERDDEAVRGSAEDFCLVVTQRRNVADTKLAVTGASARSWMAIAQCFAGGPADPPAPGARVVRYGG